MLTAGLLPEQHLGKRRPSRAGTAIRSTSQPNCCLNCPIATIAGDDHRKTATAASHSAGSLGKLGVLNLLGDRAGHEVDGWSGSSRVFTSSIAA